MPRGSRSIRRMPRSWPMPMARARSDCWASVRKLMAWGIHLVDGLLPEPSWPNPRSMSSLTAHVGGHEKMPSDGHVVARWRS